MNTLPFSSQISAWLRESTLQSNIALFGSGLTLATDLPILHGLSSIIRLSSNNSRLLLERNRKTAYGQLSGFRGGELDDDGCCIVDDCDCCWDVW